MKKSIIQKCTVLMVFLLIVVSASAAGKMRYKYGKPSMEEMEMTVYDKDTSAVALVLHKSCELKYLYQKASYSKVYTVKVRIKILKEEGKKYADVAIPYIEHSSDDRIVEYFSYFNVQSHNLVDGHIVTTTLPDNLLFDERNSDVFLTRRFSAPAVRVGTVIEYQYDLVSSVPYHIYNWNMQDDIPVAYAMCRMEIPAVLIFNVEFTSSKYMTMTTSQGHLRLNTAISCPTNVYHAVGVDMPAVKETSYVWNTDDYRAKITAELRSSELVEGQPIQHYGKTWEQVDNELLRMYGIASRMDDDSRYEELLKETGIADIADVRERVMATYRFLHRRIRWNEKYNAKPKSQSEVMRHSNGTSSDLNMLMLNMLNSVGVKSYPVMLSTRSNGRIPDTYPSMEMMNTMVLAVVDGDGTFYIDAASPYGCINVLEPNLTVSQARVLDKHSKGRWTDLTPFAKGNMTSLGLFTLDRDGILDGTVEKRYTGVMSMTERKAFLKAKDSLDYVMRLANRFAVKVDSHSISGIRDNAPEVLQNIRVRKQFDIRRDRMYVSPYVMVPVSASPFKEPKRTLPVEMPSMYSYNCTMRISLPAEYEVETVPKDIAMISPDGALSLYVVIGSERNELVVSYKMSSDKLIYPESEYDVLKKLYDTIGHRMNDVVVLKRKE